MSFDAYTELLKPIVIDDRSIDLDRVVQVEHALLDRLNVRYLLTEPGHEPGGRWRARYRGADGSLFENPSVLARFYVAEGDGDVAIRTSGPGRFTVRVRARTPVLIRSSQFAAPGWKVSSGSPADDLFLGFRLPAGDAVVEVTYRPWTFWASIPVALIALALLVLAASCEIPDLGARTSISQP